MEKLESYNPTCIITGRTDNLRMHAHRDKNGNMVGWVFIHESIIQLTADFELVFSAKGYTTNV
jgi:hypothetical protein